jgi:uncharacterized SAM-binding protein YcdF (DUF218 family)
MIRWGIRIAAGLLAIVVLYVAFTFVQVWWASRQDDATQAQAIVVLGAAQYNGEPSPVYEARLDHAADLYEQGLADIVVTTGGSQAGDVTNEANAGAAYLMEQGVPEEALRLEVDGRNSWESLAATARFLEAEGIDDVILVSDPYHSLRLGQIAGELGFDAHVSPTDSSPESAAGQLKAMVRETAAVSVGRIIGYRRLMNLDDAVGEVRESGMGIVGTLLPLP